MPMTHPSWIEEQVPLAPRTTLELGGRARYLAPCRSGEQVVEALGWAEVRGLPVLVLGGGSNLVVADEGWPGLVLEVETSGVEVEPEGEGAVVRVAAGELWDDLVARMVEQGLAGIECLSGIPGRVGAAPIQNIGAYGQEVARTLRSVSVIDRRSGERRRLPAESCGFGYRTSHFKGSWRDRYLVESVEFWLPRQALGTLAYGELKRHFEAGNEEPTLANVRAAVLRIRGSKSMVIHPHDPNRRSAGSFFMNPVVEAAVAESVEQRVREMGIEGPMPVYPADGGRKLSAAWLIERAGFARGTRRGSVGISSRHTLALVHHGGGRTVDLLKLAAEVRAGVRRCFGVTLEPEPAFVGFDRTAGEILGELESDP